MVAAPSTIPKKSGDCIKNDKRDAKSWPGCIVPVNSLSYCHGPISSAGCATGIHRCRTRDHGTRQPAHRSRFNSSCLVGDWAL